MSEAVGIFEVTGFTPAMVALDAMEKAAGVVLLQAELNDFLGTVIKLQGTVSALKEALEVGRGIAERMGGQPKVALLTNPLPNVLQRGILSRQEFSPLLQQNVVLGSSNAQSPSDQGEFIMSDAASKALGFIETQGFTAVFEAIDHACKAANVEVIAKEKLGGGYVTVVIQGDVAAVKAAIDAGQSKVEGLGKLIAAHVIARPSAAVWKLLPAS